LPNYQPPFMGEEGQQNKKPHLGRKFWTYLFTFIVIGGVIVYLLTGIYQIGPSEQGLVKKFGKYFLTVGPGLHYHLPAPFESVVKVDVRTVRSMEIGFRTVSPPPNPRYSEVPSESLMLTGDDNIISLEAIIQYVVSDPASYAFNIINVPQIIKETTESFLRKSVAERNIQSILTTGRVDIAQETKIGVQQTLTAYKIGIHVLNVKLQDVSPPKQVIAAFDDVNSAKVDEQNSINVAESYATAVVPQAEGQAQVIINNAEAYEQSRILKAQGEVSKFLDVLKRYNLGEEVTRERLYIETMESILPNMKKIIVPENTSGILKLLDLNSLSGIEGGKK